MAEEARIRLILDWIEKHPDAPRRVAGKLHDLLTETRRAHMIIQNYIKDSELQAKVRQRLWKTYHREKLETLGQIGAIKRTVDTLNVEIAERRRAEARIQSIANRLARLREEYSKAAKAVQASTLSDRGKVAALNYLKREYIEHQNRLLGVASGHRLAERAMQFGRAEMERHPPLLKRIGTSLYGLGRRFRAAGLRIGWFAFRTVIMGRLILRYVLSPTKKAIRMLMDYDRTLTDVATTMGLLSYFGMLTGKRQDFLKNTMYKVLEAGMKLKAAFGYLSAVFASIAADVLPLIVPPLIEIADAIREVWESSKDELIPAFKELIDSILPPLIDIVKEVGPAFIKGLVQGIRFSLPLIIGLIKALTPFAPLIGKIVGVLIPFAPILVAIGSAAYIIGPIISALGGIFQILGFFAMSSAGGLAASATAMGGAAAAGTGLTGILGSLLGVLAPLLPIIAAVAGAIIGIILIIQHWSEIVSFFQGVWQGLMDILQPIMPILESIGNMLYQLGRVIYEIARFVGAAFYVAFQKVAEILGPILGPVIKSISDGFNTFMNVLRGLANIVMTILKPALDWFKGIIDAISGALGGFADWLSGVTNALLHMCFKHAAADARKFSRELKTLNYDLTATQSRVGSLTGRLLEVGPAMPGGGGSPTQYVTVHASISIGSVSSEVDLDALSDAINRGIGEALRRRLS